MNVSSVTTYCDLVLFYSNLCFTLCGLPIQNSEEPNFITGLRAIAIFLVFLIHSGGGGLRKLGEAFNLFVDFGKYGVAMFFVISGFTIFYQLYSGNYSYTKFLKIRISRISIPYFPLIIIIFAYISLGGEQFNPWAIKFNNGVISLFNLFTHLTYLASFSTKYATTIIGPEWTLHIEVFYYLILGYLITIGFLENKFRRLFFALIGSILIAFLFLYLGHANLLDPLLVQWMPFKYAWMFVLGGVGYYCRNLVNNKLSKQIQNIISNLTILLSITSIILLLNCKVINGVGPLNEAFFACLHNPEHVVH